MLLFGALMSQPQARSIQGQASWRAFQSRRPGGPSSPVSLCNTGLGPARESSSVCASEWDGQTLACS